MTTKPPIALWIVAILAAGTLFVGGISTAMIHWAKKNSAAVDTHSTLDTLGNGERQPVVDLLSTAYDPTPRVAPPPPSSKKHSASGANVWGPGGEIIAGGSIWTFGTENNEHAVKGWVTVRDGKPMPGIGTEYLWLHGVLYVRGVDPAQSWFKWDGEAWQVLGTTKPGGPPPPPPPRAFPGVLSSGTKSSTFRAAGNNCPPLGDLLANGPYLGEFKRDIRGDSKDADSDEILATWMPYRPLLHVDFSATGQGTRATGHYGIPVNVVPHDYPLFPVTFTTYAAMSEPGPVPMVPFGSFEGTPPHAVPPTTAPSGDRHQVILVKGATGQIVTEWDIYQPTTADNGNTWIAGGGAKFDLAGGDPRPADWTSTDAAGFPIAPLLLRYDEVASGEIHHAIRATFPAAICRGKVVYPARHAPAAGGKLCFGARMRLTESWYAANIAKYSGQARVILDAMRKHGIINSDITGTGLGYGAFICGVTDDRWDADGTSHGIFALQKVPMSAFEVVEQKSGWTITGPTSIALGQTATYTLARYPSWDKNFAGNVYIHVNGKNEPPGASGAAVLLKDGQTTGSWSFTPTEPGLYEIKGNHGNQLWKDAAPIRLTVSP